MMMSCPAIAAGAKVKPNARVVLKKRNRERFIIVISKDTFAVSEPLIYSVRPESFGELRTGFVEGQMAHRQGLRQAQPERVGVFQSFLSEPSPI
jgi:hypothetical protein